MSQVIVYKNDSDGVSIIVPSPEALETYGIEAIAEKDVPAGKAFKIVSASLIPQDRTFRAAWTIDDSELTDGIGGIITSFEVTHND
jgi:hypothetical protein